MAEVVQKDGDSSFRFDQQLDKKQVDSGAKLQIS